MYAAASFILWLRHFLKHAAVRAETATTADAPMEMLRGPNTNVNTAIVANITVNPIKMRNTPFIASASLTALAESPAGLPIVLMG